MTVVKKEYTSSRSYHSYDVLLQDGAGTRYYVVIDDNSFMVWRHLRQGMKVNTQLVRGNVALIANGTEVAQSQDQPQVSLHNLYERAAIFGVFMVPVVAVVVAVVKRKRRQHPVPAPFSRSA